MDEIAPLRNFIIIYIYPTVSVMIVFFLKKWFNKQEKKEEMIGKSISRIEESFTEIKINNGEMMKKEDARDEFVDKNTFSLHAKNIDTRFDNAEKIASETKLDLKDVKNLLIKIITGGK